MSPIGRRCARLELRRRRPRAVACAIGIVFFVGTQCAALADVELNLGFETLDSAGVPAGWNGGGGADVASDTAAKEGERALRVTRVAAGVTRVTRRVAADALRPSGASRSAVRLRLTGLARTEPGVSAALWLRVDGPRGPLFLDSGGYSAEPPTGSSPSPPANDDGAWRRFEVEVPLPRDAEEIALGVSSRGRGAAWFDALELSAEVTDGWPAAGPAAVRYLDAALSLMREHSVRRAEIDWTALRGQALEHARGATTTAQTHVAVRFALRELGDRHSYLQSAAATRALATTAVSNARTGSPPTTPQGRRLGERIAYVAVPGFAGGTPGQQVEFAETLKKVIQANDASTNCGWVVDLRQNTGGNLWPMLAGLGPLLGEGDLAASVYPDGRRVTVWYRDGQAGFGDYTQLRVWSPYRLDRTVPVAVLLGPATASTGEVLAVAFRSRAATRSFGGITRGLSGGNRTFALADGASLVLTVAATSDTAGRLYTGPIAPDEAVTPTDRASGGEARSDAPLAAALDWLMAGDSCR